MQILKGQPVADKILADVATRIDGLSQAPRLVVVCVGEDAVRDRYIQYKKDAAERVGVVLQERRFAADISTTALRREIAAIVRTKPTGIIIQLPLPNTIRTQYILDAVPMVQDVDGLSARNMGRLVTGRPAVVPPTAQGILALLDYYTIPYRGNHVVLVGSGRLVGRPTGLLFLAHDATVTFTHIATEDIMRHTRQADILVSGVGKPGLITPEWIAPETIVVDAGTSIVDGSVVGDVAVDSMQEHAKALAPVPGGIGPLTVAVLLRNVVDAAEQQAKS